MRRSRRALAIAVSTSTIVVVTLAALSPLAMSRLPTPRTSWADLADIGQAYGGASAILSALALAAIAASLLLQWRQMAATRNYETKKLHLDLVRIAVDNPQLLTVDGPPDPDGQLKAYANLLVSHWAMAWDVGSMSDRSLRANAARLFQQAVVREWWRDWGDSYSNSQGRDQFVRILNREYVIGSTNASTASRPITAQDSRGVPVEGSIRWNPSCRSLGYAALAALVLAGCVTAARRRSRTGHNPAVRGHS